MTPGILLLALLWTQPPPELQQDFEAGTERALQGDLEGAAGLYRSILQRTGPRPDVYFNLGNVYAEMGRSVDAVVAYELALRLAPSDEDIQANLQLVRAQLAKKKRANGIGHLEAESLTLADTLGPLLAPLPITFFAYAVLISEGLFFLALWFRRKSAQPKARRAWTIVTALTGLFALGAAGITAGHWTIHHDVRAVVRKTQPLRQGPDDRFKVAGDVDAGARVRILDEERGWTKIQPTDGTTGWIESPTLTVISFSSPKSP